ncbi:MAG: insulinase family protein [Oscillospiraceae bacterium]|nr:insulinase family protein [Oscillospiraceae bacterium]
MILTDDRTGDSCTVIQHKSGLEIRIMEMPEFKTAAAQFAARFGSQCIAFRTAPGEPVTEMPCGIAHYLEHKLFENADEDASELFSRLGAFDNAYTDTDRTVYYFQTSRAFPEALRVLLQFVQSPHFTEKSVSMERGIIAQELQEALDDPADCLMMQLLQGMYHRHPVRTHVLGTQKSIRQITPQMLYRCWESFYNLHNMVLCCAGNIRTEDVLQAADEILRPAEPMTAETVLPPEPEQVVTRRTECRMAVGKTQFMLGFKSEPAEGTERLRETLLCSIVSELLTGDTSPLYQRLLNEGLVNDTFATDCLAGDGWFAVTAEGESDHPDAVCNAICAEIERTKKEGLDKARFAVCKKAAYGDAVLGLNSPEAAADAMADACISGIQSPFARIQLLAQMTPEDAQNCLLKRFNPERMTLSVVLPENRKEEV